MAKWNGIYQTGIAQAVRDVALYFLLKDVGPAHNKVAQKWVELDGLADKIEQMDQKELDGLFGEGDALGYWPGKFRPTLMDLREGLKFFADREKLEGQGSKAQSLIDTIKGFDGFGGWRHCSISSYNHEIGNYIAAFPRQENEVYIAPDEPVVDVYYCMSYAFNLATSSYLPVDADTVEAKFKLAGNGSARFSKYEQLALHEASFAEGFRRAGMAVDFSVELGATYGEDTITIRMSMDEYTKFIDAKTGKRAVDLSPVEGKEEQGMIQPILTYDEFKGFEAGKTAFEGPNGTCLSVAAIQQAGSKVIDKINWLRKTGQVREEQFSLPSGSGVEEYVSFKREELSYKDEPYVVDDKYWGCTNLHNKMLDTLNELKDTLNGNTDERPKRGSVPQSKLASSWFEHAGKIYVPISVEAFEQAMFHFKATHGVDYSILDSTDFSDEMRARIDGGYWKTLRFSDVADGDVEHIRKAVVSTLDAVKSDIDAGNTGLNLAAIKPKQP